MVLVSGQDWISKLTAPDVLQASQDDELLINKKCRNQLYYIMKTLLSNETRNVFRGGLTGLTQGDPAKLWALRSETAESPILLGARIAQLVKSLDIQFIDHRFEPHCRRGVFRVSVF